MAVLNQSNTSVTQLVTEHYRKLIQNIWQLKIIISNIRNMSV